MRGELSVFTFKEGMLARMAHDLRLSVTDWEATLADGRVNASFGLASLSIDGVVHGGSVDGSALSESDKHKIHGSIQDDVLHTRQHPTARYEGSVQVSGDGATADGKLTLHGVTRDCRCQLQAHGQAWTGEVTLVPSQFGIPPFKALAGAIRLQDRMLVRVSVWLDGHDPKALATQHEATRFVPGRAR